MNLDKILSTQYLLHDIVSTHHVESLANEVSRTRFDLALPNKVSCLIPWCVHRICHQYLLYHYLLCSRYKLLSQ